MNRRPLPTSGASVYGDYPAHWDLEPSSPVPVSRRPAQDDDDLGGHMLDLEAHASGTARRADLDADEYWADRQTGAFDDRPFIDDEVA